MSVRFKYRPWYSEPSPLLTIIASANGKSSRFDEAIVDSGASYTLAAKWLATHLKLDLTAGKPRQMQGLGGGLATFYGHEIEIEIPGVAKLSALVYFGDTSFSFLLGQHGFFDQLDVGFYNQAPNPEFVIAPRT